ncbi:EipA family protein [Hoeflea sp. CAU 1731]
MRMTLQLFSKAVIQVIGAVFLLLAASWPASAQQYQQQTSPGYTVEEVQRAGEQFFGSATDGLARVVERAFERYGLPNGYILGQEGSGAFFGGLTYGEGQLYTKNAGEHTMFWQGPSVGFDWGGQGSQVMMLVYDLNSVNDIYGRFAGASGQAYAVAGAGMTVLQGGRVIVVPIRTGLGVRVGLNLGYLKMTGEPTWNPF